MNVNWTDVTRRIEIINLSENNLTYLDDSMFTFMDYQLRMLWLDKNSIATVNLTRAIYLPKTLDLKNNKVRQFISPIDKHQIKTHMDSLYLNDNGITNLNDIYFQFPENLLALDLSSNDIKGIMNENKVTKTIQNTKELWFNYNNIIIVNHDYLPESTWFTNNPNLHQVDSKSTKLKALHVKTGNRFAQDIQSNDFKFSKVTVY